jgi:imidazolonepropionase-like amidohydrolase
MIHVALRAGATALIVLAALAPARAWAQQDLAIVGARVHTEPGTVIENATIVVRNGRVRAVGTSVPVPAGALRIDGTGKVVTAGFIDASTRLGLVEVSQVESTNEGSFDSNGRTVFASYRTADGYNFDSVAIPVARTGGVTSVVATPAGAFVAGISGGFALRDKPLAARPGELVIRRDVALHVNLGRQALAANHKSRGIAVARLRELFDDAARYNRTRGAYDRNQSRELAATRLDLEALLLALRKQIPMVVRVDRASDLRAVVRLARELDVRLIVEGGTEAWRMAGELAAARIPVLLDPTFNLPATFDHIHVRDDAIARLAGAGVPVIISTLGDAANVRNLRQLAGIAVAHGLPREKALAAVTSTPASAFGLGKRGTLARGNVADVVVWSGDPFELSTAVEHVFVGGVEQPLGTRQSRLLDRYRELPAR